MPANNGNAATLDEVRAEARLLIEMSEAMPKRRNSDVDDGD
jgi:hypothetical protein